MHYIYIYINYILYVFYILLNLNTGILLEMHYFCTVVCVLYLSERKWVLSPPLNCSTTKYSPLYPVHLCLAIIVGYC